MHDTDILYNARTGRYRDVYKCNSRPRGYQAIIRVNERTVYLGSQPTAREAAEMVVKWYKKQYGFLWKRILQYPCTRRTPWSIVRVRNLGFRVTVYVAGTPIIVTPQVLGWDKDHPDREGWSWTGLWMTRRWGIYAMREFVSRFRGIETEKRMSVLFRV